jgi:hypothetical protein
MSDTPWLEIRNSAGHLLFRYNPFTNEIELKKNGYVYDLIRLDEIRAKHGVIEPIEKTYTTVTIPSKRLD